MSELQVDVLNLHLNHPRVAAENWRWPLVCRLLRHDPYHDGTLDLSDTFRDRGSDPVQGQVGLRWNGCSEQVRRCLNTYQEHVITEHATLGVACILVEHRAGMEIWEVTNRRDKADYWVGNGKKELLLEISGRQTCDLTALLKEKTKQLRENPYGEDGYVCVAEYEGRTAFLVYCEFEVR